MSQKEEKLAGETASESSAKQSKLISKRVTDHLANERTFLAWMRTGLATITFGFVVARFGLFLRELGLKSQPVPVIAVHYSTLIGVALTVLGTVTLIFALLSFLFTRRAIDREEFHPQAGFAIVLTVLATLISVLLAIYLLLTA